MHVGRGRGDLGIVGEAERDAARVRLVEQSQRLQHDRVAELGRGCPRVVGRCRAAGGAKATPPSARSSRDSKYPSPLIGAAGSPTAGTP